MLDKFVYNVDNVVVGNGLNAVLFAYLNNYVFINNEFREPFRFDFLPPSLDLSRVFVPREQVILQGKDEKKNLVSPKQMYTSIFFLLCR